MKNNNLNKKHHNWWLLIPVFLLLMLIGFGYYYVTKPEVVFNMFLNNVYENIVSDEKINQMKLDLDMDFNVDIGEDYKKITNLINDIKLSTSFNYDLQNKNAIFSLGTSYKDKSLVDANMYYENNVMYFELKDLFDKLIKMDMSETIDEEIELSLEDINIIMEEITNALKKALKVAEYTSSKEKVNNEELIKNTIIINNENKQVLCNAFIDYLLNSNTFIETVSKTSDLSKEEIIKNLRDSKEIEDIEEIKISIYTKNLTNEFVKLSINYVEEEIFNLTKNKNVYTVEAKEEDVLVTSVVTVNGNKINIVTSTNSEDIKLEININMVYTYDEQVKMPTVAESISIDELTEEDTSIIMDNLMKNEGVIKLVETISSMIPEDNLDEDTNEFYYE